MATHTFHGYSTEAFSIDPETGDAVLLSAKGRARFEVTDNDQFADGDAANDEVGDDEDQTALVYGDDGSVVGDGRIYIEEVRWYQSADGDIISVTVFEINGVPMGYVPSAPLTPGENYTYTGSSEAGQKIGGKNNNASRNNYNSFEDASVACFGPGTMVMTEDGEMPVEWLETGDRVLTLDNDYCDIVWIGRSRLAARARGDKTTLVALKAGILGPDMPSHDLLVTSDHRVLLQSSQLELDFGVPQAFAPAKAWVEAELAEPVKHKRDTSVFHFACATHQVVLAQGAWVETFLPAQEATRRLDPASLRRLQAAGLATGAPVQAAKPCLTLKEAVDLLGKLDVQTPQTMQGAAT